MSGGGLALVSGGVLLALHGRGTCDLEPGQRQCPNKLDNLVPGIGLVAAGAAGIGLGFYLGRGDDDDTRVSVAPGRNGAALWVTGRF